MVIISKLIDVIQHNNSIYERYNDGKILKKKWKPYGYILKDNVRQLKVKKNFLQLNSLHKDLFNRDVYKVYLDTIKYDYDNIRKLFGIDINYLYYMKDKKLSYSENEDDYRIWYWDIEVSIGRENEDNTPDHPNQPIVSISVYDTINKKYYVIGWHEKETKDINKYKYRNVKTEDNEDVTYIYVKNEYELLKIFIGLLKKYKPIMLIGWYSNWFDIPYLVRRLEINNIDTKHLSPINEKVRVNKPEGKREYYIDIPGLYSIELNKLIERYIYVKFPSMGLDAVSKQLGLGQKIEVNLDLDYRNNFEKFMKYNINDVRLTKKINDNFNITGFIIYLHNLVNIPFNNLLSTSLIVRNAIIKNTDEIVIERRLQFKNYQGAIVLNPFKQGIIHNVCTLDANSMYPTSTITFNISPDTFICSYDDINNHKDDIDDYLKFNISKIVRKDIIINNKYDKSDLIKYVKNILKDNNIPTIDTGYSDELNEKGYLFMHHTYKTGLYTRYQKEVYDLRKEVKGKMKKAKDSVEYRKYDAIQQALKLILNSTYGANGYQGFFLYDPRIAESITYFARKLLQFGMNELREKGYDIQYGDSVSKDSEIIIKDKDGNIRFIKIEELFNENKKYTIGDKEYNDLEGIYTPSLNMKTDKIEWKPIKYIMRHKIDSDKKKMYRVWINNTQYVDVTEDHSLIGYRGNKYKEVTVKELKDYKLFTYENGLIDYQKIEEIKYNDYVFDIEVEDNHTFFANNILVHNTDSFFIILKTQEDDFEKCLTEGNMLNDIINNRIYKYHTLKYMNEELPKQYHNYLGFKLEHILHYIYFGDSKKRYFGIEYPDKDGKEGSYVRGMNVIRKDAPKIIKKLLNDLTYKIIKNEILKEDFDNVKKEIIKAKLEDIGIIKSFNKNFNNYKVLPQHVKGAKFAHEIFNVRINNFDKPYMFYVKFKKRQMKQYKYFDGVICLNKNDLDLLRNSDIIEIDYDTLFNKQILEPLKEFKYVENLSSILNTLKYLNKHSKYDTLFDF